MPSRSVRRKKRWFVLAAAVLLLTAGWAFVYYPPLPANAPAVLVSVDRSLWNRAGLNRLTHTRALRDAGLRPLIVDFESADFSQVSADEFLDRFDALVLGGGGDVDAARYGSDLIGTVGTDPRRDEFELALLDAAERRGMPVLGLCRGAQLINVHRGGTLGDFRADSERYDRHHRMLSGHAVELDAASRLASIYGQPVLENVVTYHGQYVDLPGEGVSIVGYAPDGTPEAIEVETQSSEFGIVGVQWHAEAQPWSDVQHRLFKSLADAAAAYRGNRNASD